MIWSHTIQFDYPTYRGLHNLCYDQPPFLFPIFATFTTFQIIKRLIYLPTYLWRRWQRRWSAESNLVNSAFYLEWMRSGCCVVEHEIIFVKHSSNKTKYLYLKWSRSRIFATVCFMFVFFLESIRRRICSPNDLYGYPGTKHELFQSGRSS